MIDPKSNEKAEKSRPGKTREERLAEVLRSNLKRRKESARDRTGDKDNTRDE